MKVTSARVFIYEKEGSTLKGFCSIVIDNVFVVDGFRIMYSAGKNVLWVAMPSAQKGGEWKDTAFFLDKTAREEFQAIVMAEYHKQLALKKEEGNSYGNKQSKPKSPQNYPQPVSNSMSGFQAVDDDDDIPF